MENKLKLIEHVARAFFDSLMTDTFDVLSSVKKDFQNPCSKKKDSSKQNLQDIEQSFSKLKLFLKENSYFVQFLKNPLFNEQEKNIFFSEWKLPEKGEEFLNFLIRFDCLKFLPEIIDAFQNCIGGFQQILSGTLILSDEKMLDSQGIKELKTSLETYLQKKLDWTYKIDPLIYGGFIVDMPPYYMDASLKGKLYQYGK